jgi:hypothetical protein
MIPDSPHGQNQEGTPKMDDETCDWPISDTFTEELNKLKYNFQAIPLPLYHNGTLLSLLAHRKVINDAMVEVHFGILHWHIRNFNSFQANIKRIIILKPGYRCHMSNYKCPHSDNEESEPEAKRIHSNTTSSA